LTEFAPALAFPLAQPLSQDQREEDHLRPPEMMDPDQTKNAVHPCDPSDQETHSLYEKPPPVIYGPPSFACTPQAGKFAATDFQPQPDAPLRCPAGHPLYAQIRRPERDGTVRVPYAARLSDCRGCP